MTRKKTLFIIVNVLWEDRKTDKVMLLKVIEAPCTLISNFLGCGAPQAPHYALLGQRRVLLPGLICVICRPQLPQPEPQGHHPGPGSKRDMRC